MTRWFPRFPMSAVFVFAALIVADAAFRPAAAAPVVRTISGQPLIINVGDDTSMQVVDTRAPGTTSFQPYGCAGPGATGDAGVLVSVSGTVFGPDFPHHACVTGADADTPWTPVSISSVSGSGEGGDPFTVVVIVDAGTSGLRLEETLSYTNGSGTVATSFRFFNLGSAPISWSTFLAADLSLIFDYVSASLRGASTPVGQAEIKPGAPIDCIPSAYYAFFPAGDRYTGNSPVAMWGEISAGGLSNTLGQHCFSGGIAVEWVSGPLDPGATTTAGPPPGAGISFGGVFPAQTIPGLTSRGVRILVAVLGIAGAALARDLSRA